jgi:mannose-6-phosphate isomerase-like protein (cupin superfamily)
MFAVQTISTARSSGDSFWHTGDITLSHALPMFINLHRGVIRGYSPGAEWDATGLWTAIDGHRVGGARIHLHQQNGVLMDVKNLNDVPAFTTKDGSEIRELLAYRNSGIRNQSLAEARLPVGGSTQEHFHPKAEEIYYITHGTGRIRIEGELREVKPGDAIAIPPGQRHKLWNTGVETLRLLCCCAPAYEHSDTIITET